MNIPGLYCFYTLQGERGESDAHPNAFYISASTDDHLTLEEFVKAFPLAGTAAFHYRFQVPAPVGKAYLDLTNPKDRIPISNGTITAKVLRLGAQLPRVAPKFIFVSCVVAVAWASARNIALSLSISDSSPHIWLDIGLEVFGMMQCLAQTT